MSQTHVRDVSFDCLTGPHADLHPGVRIACCEMSQDDVIPGIDDEAIPLIHTHADRCSNEVGKTVWTTPSPCGSSEVPPFRSVTVPAA